MPFVYRSGTPPPLPSQADQGPSVLRRFLAGAMRTGAGWGASIPAMEPGIGSAVGAGIAGIGEMAAEGIEGSPMNAKRIALEAGLGAVPLGAIFKAGRPVQSAIRSAALAGTGEAGRELTSGEELSPGRIATTTGLGGLLGGILGRFPSEAPKVAGPPPMQIETTAVPGGRVLGDKGITRPIPTPTAKWRGAAPSPTNPLFDEAMLTRAMDELAPRSHVGMDATTAFGTVEPPAPATGAGVPYMEAGTVPYGSAARSAGLEQRQGIKAIAEKLRAAKAAEKLALEQEKLDTIRAAREEAGVEPSEPRFGTAMSAKNLQGGSESMRIGFKQPGEEGDLGSDLLPPPAPTEPLVQIPARFRAATRIPLEGLPEALQAPIPQAVAPTPSPAIPEAPGATGEPVDQLAAIKDILNPKETALNGPRSMEPRLVRGGVPVDINAVRAERLRAPLRGTPAEIPPTLEETAAQQRAAREPYLDVAEGAPQQGIQVEQAGPQSFGELINPQAQAGMDALKAGFKGQMDELDVPAAVPAPAITAERASKMTQNRMTQQPEVADALDELGARYDVATGAEKRGLGAQMSEIRQFLEGKGKYGPPKAPKGAASTAAAVPEPTAPLTTEVPGTSTQTRFEDLLAEARDNEAATEGRVPKGASVDIRENAIVNGVLENADFYAEQAGLDPKAFRDFVTAKYGPRVPTEAIPDWIAEQNALIDKFKGEKGSVDPALLGRVGLAGLGAAAGGIAGGAVGHPFIGMAAGALGGALAPDAIRQVLTGLGAHPSTVEGAVDAISAPSDSPVDIKGMAHRIYQTLPQVQRFNYLADATGLPANAWFGPYGSAMMAGLEHMLSGDPRGADLLKRLTPNRFAQEYRASIDEARRLIQAGDIGRAESSFGEGPLSRVVEMPGQLMTAGDVAARRIIEEAGFSEEEARRFTMTGEPETTAMQHVANFSKGSPLLQMLQPFARTPANIAEQGAMRIPGIGSIVQSFREVPDSLRQQMVQQALGGAEMLGTTAVGSQVDPETGKQLRRFLTNLGGQYSLPANIGFSVGQAMRAGKPLGTAAVGAAAGQGLPIPTIQPALDWGQFLTGNAPLPRGAVPAQLYDMLFPSSKLPSSNIPTRLRKP